MKKVLGISSVLALLVVGLLFLAATPNQSALESAPETDESLSQMLSEANASAAQFVSGDESPVIQSCFANDVKSACCPGYCAAKRDANNRFRAQGIYDSCVRSFNCSATNNIPPSSMSCGC